MIQSLTEKFNRFIQALENSAFSPLNYGLVFTGFVLLRNFMELFSDNDTFPSIFNMLHYGLWYLATVLSLSIIFWVFTREKMEKILKINLFFIGFVCLAPVLDLILTLGKGANMNYLNPTSATPLWQSYLLFLYSREGSATLGVRIEVFLILAAAFYYMWQFKRKGFLTAILGTWISYSVLFFFGAYGIFVNFYAGFFGLSGISFSGETIILSLVSLNLPLIALVAAACNWENLKAILKQLSNPEWLFLIALFLAGIFLINPHFFNLAEQSRYNIWHYTVFYMLAIGLVWLSQKTLANPEFQESALQRYFGYGSLAVGLVLGINYQILNQAYLVTLGLLQFLYDQKPAQLRTWPVVSKLVLGVRDSLVFFSGFTFAGGEFFMFPKQAIWFFWIGLGSMHLAEDAQNAKPWLKQLAGGLCCAISMGLPFYFAIPEHAINFGLLGLLQYYLINRPGFKMTHLYWVWIFALIYWYAAL